MTGFCPLIESVGRSGALKAGPRPGSSCGGRRLPAMEAASGNEGVHVAEHVQSLRGELAEPLGWNTVAVDVPSVRDEAVGGQREASPTVTTVSAAIPAKSSGLRV